MYCAGGFTVEDGMTSLLITLLIYNYFKAQIFCIVDLLKPYLGALEGELETIIGLPKTMLIKVLQDFGYVSL